MASDVDVCNLALGYLGDEATVVNINPPDGSAQAALCSRFYPIARDSLLEMHPWGFAAKRVPLALLSATPPSQWAYVYAQPSDELNLLGVYDPSAMNDTAAAIPMPNTYYGAAQAGQGIYTPQPFVAETLPDGTDVIYTNQQYAVLHYTSLIADTTKFSPLFTEALAWLLASKLAGPLLKGQVGAEAARSCMAAFQLWLGKATASDANQRRQDILPGTPWMTGR